MPDISIARAGAHYRAKEFDDAARCALEIIAQAPDHFDALHLLGVLCHRRGLAADAANYFERAARSQPNHRMLNVNRANAWLALDQFARAEALGRQVLASQPNDLDAFNMLALAMGQQTLHEQAIAVYRTALAHRPDHPQSLYNLGKVLATLGRLNEAETAYREALRYAPPDRAADVLISLGGVLRDLDRPDEALALFQAEKARCAEPLVLSWFESLLHLQLGDYAAGWPAYESRWRVAGHDKPHTAATIPDITTVAGKRILLVGEQGRGDVVQFARFASLLAERGATVYLRVYDDLRSLLSTLAGVSGVLGEDSLDPPHDVVTQLLSLPLAFGTTIATIPAKIPYLRADPERVARWRAHLGGVSSRQIGLAWSSTNPGAERSTALARLRPLLERDDATFHALQKEIGSADLDFMRTDGRVRDHRSLLTDFSETAALIEALDLVITIDTVVAHVAGALGKPVWILLPHVAEWRWLRHRTDCPWYPTARLYRQPSPGDWDGLAAQVVVALGN